MKKALSKFYRIVLTFVYVQDTEEQTHSLVRVINEKKIPRKQIQVFGK